MDRAKLEKLNTTDLKHLCEQFGINCKKDKRIMINKLLEPFSKQNQPVKIELDELLQKFKENKLNIKMEHERYKLGWRMYSILNHAEVSGYTNPSDGDLWDIVIPGYNHQIKQTYFKSNHIIGIFKLSDGNSKIFMRIDYDGYDPKRSKEDFEKFTKEYLFWNNKLIAKWINIKGFNSKL